MDEKLSDWRLLVSSCSSSISASVASCVVVAPLFATEWISSISLGKEETGASQIARFRKPFLRLRKAFGILFVLGLVSSTVLVAAMGIWGMIKVNTDVKEVVPDSFAFIENTERELHKIHSNLTSAVANGYERVEAVRNATEQVQEDVLFRFFSFQPEYVQTANDTLIKIQRETDRAEEAIEEVDKEINDVRRPILFESNRRL